MNRMSSRIAALAVGLLCIDPASACPASALDMPLEALFGAWEARFDDLPAATVQLDRHPEYPGVRGTVTRGGGVAQLAGDVAQEGWLILDESADGHAISGVWHGALQPGTCGKAFQGLWRDTADGGTHPFVLTRIDHGTGSSR
jgi:hypothetical protein